MSEYLEHGVFIRMGENSTKATIDGRLVTVTEAIDEINRRANRPVQVPETTKAASD